MPNGGYPMHLLTPLGNSGVEILTSEWHINVRRRLDEGLYEFGAGIAQLLPYSTMTQEEFAEKLSGSEIN